MNKDQPSAPGPTPPPFPDVFREHAGYVLGLLRRLGVADGDAEDVAQEVFVVVHARLSTFEARSTLKTWICGICVRKASDYRRKAHRRYERPSSGSEQAGPDGQVDTSDGEAQLIRRQQSARLAAALNKLGSKRLEVFVLYEIEELPMPDVARALGCPLFTAYTRLRSARRELQTIFRRLEAEPVRWSGTRDPRQVKCAVE